MNPAANGSVRAPHTLKKNCQQNSALELFIQNGATIRSAIFVHSYGYMISVPLVLHWVYGQQSTPAPVV